MKAIIFSGSPRKHGNTMQLVNRFIDGLRESGCEVEFIDTTKLNISPCIGCGACEQKGNCFMDDDMKEIYEKTEESDIIVLASPVYFASVTAQLKTMIDRFQAFYSRRYVLKLEREVKRKGYLIYTAGLKNDKIYDCMYLLSKFFMLSVDADLQEPIYAKDTDEVPVFGRIDILEKAYEAGLEAGRD
jgi:multimeric flavodoxin WrbA